MSAPRTVARLSLALALAACGPALGQGAGVCFRPTDRPSVSVIQNAPPPKADGELAYPYYPVTEIASMQLSDLLSSRSSVHKYYWQWANHGPRLIAKGNLAPGVAGRTKTVSIDFSSPEVADACTLAQTAAVLGRSAPAAASAARRLGLTRNIPAGTQSLDTCILPQQALLPGIDLVLDYEVQDGRSPAETLSFLTQYAAFAHAAGKRVLLYTNPLDAPGQSRTGINAANAPQIARAFDGIDVLLWSKNRQGDIAASFEAQMRMLGPARNKGYVVFELGGTSMGDAATVRRLMTANGMGKVMFWRNYAQQGGDCSTLVNRKIACVAFGRCG